MSYKLYTDKNDEFSCEISVKNASMKNSIARLIVESPDGVNLVFNGKIEGDKCVIPIKRLKGLIEENMRGNMHLEVIVEDTYFTPWKSDFVVEEHTSVKVKVNEHKELQRKPAVQVRVSQQKQPKKGINVYVPLKEISIICEMFGIRKHNLQRKKNEFIQILKEYFNSNSEYKNHKSTILSKLPTFMK